MNLTRVTVHTDNHSYDIHIGDKLDIAAHLKNLDCSSLHIVTDDVLDKLHGAWLKKQLQAKKISAQIHVIKGREQAKSIQGFENLLTLLLEAGIDRKSVIVAWGGGVIGDLVGFTAASMMRGVRYIQIPTSLLAQVDSSVGGKTGINMPMGKNLVGAFYQPEMVLINYGILKSLPLREMQAGYAEIVKYGLINDKAFFNWLLGGGQANS